jgi:hypothetical protein
VTGSLLRRHQQLLARSKSRCRTCRHLALDHREVPVTDPGYQLLLFACRAPGCRCRISLDRPRAGAR